MIEVTRLNDSKVTINVDLVERIEECPETIITFINGSKLIVKESVHEIEEKYFDLKQKIYGTSKFELLQK